MSASYNTRFPTGRSVPFEAFDVALTADEMREAAIAAADRERWLIRLAFHWRWSRFAKCDACGCPAPGTSLYLAKRCTKAECAGHFRPAGYTPPPFPYVRVSLFP